MALKLRAPVPFPANVAGNGGIKVSKQNGEWTVEPAFDELASVIASAVSDPTSKQVWIFDPVSGVYNTLTLAALGDALYVATSTTSLAIEMASKTFAIQTGKDFGVGSFVIATSDADPTNFMTGQVTSYDGGSLVVDVTATGGSGTHADWTIRPSNAVTIGGADTAASVNSLAVGGATLGDNVLAVGVDGEDTRAQFMGKVGNYIVSGSGDGIVGIGGPPHEGISLWVRDSVSDIVEGERAAVNFSIIQTPTDVVASATAVFGELVLAQWAGSVDNSATALFNGTQIAAQLTGSASVKLMQGAETYSQHLGTGTAVDAIGVWGSVKNQSTGTIGTAAGGLFNVGNSGGGTVTNAYGVHIRGSQGTNVHGLHIEDQTAGTTENYAIYTGLGAVRFGDAVTAVSLTTGQLYGIGGSKTIKVGNGTDPATLVVNGQSGQGVDLFDVQHAGTNVFRIASSGGVVVSADSTFNGAILFSTGTRIDAAVGAQFASSLGIKWSSTSAYSGTKDLGINRNAAGVAEVNNGTAGTLRDLTLRNVVGQTGYTEMVEMTAPSAPAANGVRLYAVDNGSGKTQLMALFSSGAAVQVAIQP